MPRKNSTNHETLPAVFATSSHRKTLGLTYQVDKPNPYLTDLLRTKGLDLTIQGPAYFHQRLEEEIPNGDNHLSEDAKVEIGTIGKRPIITKAQRGEKETYEAGEESRNKVEDVSRKLAAQGEEVIVFASDVVSHNPHSSDKLGKPPKHPQYPKNNPTSLEIRQFEAWYMDKYFPPGTEIVHVHAFSILNMMTDAKIDYGVEIVQTVPNDIRQRDIRFYNNSGGAGVAQQIVDWNGNVLEEITDEQMRNHFSRLSSEEQKIGFYLHLIGVPGWMLKKALEELTQPKGNQYAVKTLENTESPQSKSAHAK
ncbi:MAG: hypothetical protein QG639_920 [Patescibacteria group bacterium]|jgi:hypothetical protein|nr:hypothetical protein [Patescibacteria group bacterium]